MKGFYKNVIIICSLIFCLFFFASPSQSYYGGPGPFPYYQQPINININLGGYPGSYSTGYPNYMGYPPSGYVGGTGPYGNSWMMALPPTSASIAAASAKFSFMNSTSDGDYVYVGFVEAKGQNRNALAIFEDSGSDDFEYLSHITLEEAPEKILIHDDLAIIGAHDKGTVYLIDISDKEDPELVNELVLGKEYQSGGHRSGVIDLAIEEEVLFISIEFLANHSEVLFALDISIPEDTDEEDDLLDSYILDDDFTIYSMVSTPDYLYISGKDHVDSDVALFIMDISDPEHLSLIKVFDELGDSTGHEPEISIVGEGNYIFAIVDMSEDYGPYSNMSFKFKIIDIGSDPDDPEVIASSDEVDGYFAIGKGIVVKDNYAFVAVRMNGVSSESRIYVFDLSDPKDLIEVSQKVDGTSLDLFLVDENLCLHTTQTMKVFDISEPEDLSVIETIDLEDILEDELDGWGVYRSSSGGYSQYGFSTPFYSYSAPGSASGYGTSYMLNALSRPVNPQYGMYSGWGYSGWGGPTYSSYDLGGYSGWGGPTYGSWGGLGYSGWGGPPYGNYGPSWGYSGWGNWY